MAPESQDSHRQDLRNAIRFERPEPVTESTVLGTDDRRRWFQWHNTALRQQDGTLAGWACLGFEVTEHRALREQYLQAQKLESIGRLAGGFAHDFNNLLTVIIGFGELLLTAVEDGSPLRYHTQQILKAGEQAAALSQQLLTFSRKHPSKPKPVDLNQVIGDVVKLLSRVLGDDIEVVVKLAPELGIVMADSNQVHQMLLNLAVNARDAMARGGKLTLSTSNIEVETGTAGQHVGVPTGSYVQIIVADTGTGMSKEVLSQIFEPFFTTKEVGKGTGLGLATVYGIVRQSRGWIRVWSELGCGTAFHIYLPQMKAPPVSEPDNEEMQAGLSGSETILLVEDQSAVLQFASKALESYGYRILPAANGATAIALATEYPETIHLLLTDLVMPDMNGRSLAENLKAARPEMRIVYMTGHAPESPDPSADSIGANNTCLLKPLTARVLATKIRAVLNA